MLLVEIRGMSVGCILRLNWWTNERKMNSRLAVDTQVGDLDILDSGFGVW
jgi:hypothetical protein